MLDDVEGMTGYYDSNLNGKCLRAAKEFIENKNQFDFGFVHVKAVDDAGHDKNRAMKVTQLEKVDKALAEMVAKLGEYIS
jgi:2,3-bisphosphoglycerate-independent phosphoglycerate mutase